MTSRRTAACIAMVSTLALAAFFAVWGYPAEDAAMIFAYAENIADGHGVVYNPGGEKVDGASDLLLTLLLALISAAGAPVDVATAALNAICLSAILWMVFRSWNSEPCLPRATPIAALVIVLSTTPFLYLGTTGFGTIVFSCLIAAVPFAIQSLGSDRRLKGDALIGGLVALAGMNRVEGFALAGSIVVAYAFATHKWRPLIRVMAVALGVTAFWFAFRWSYFGYPLPNAWYKKGGAVRPKSLALSAAYVASFLLPWIPLLGAGLLNRASRRRTLSISLGVVAPWTAIWALMSNEMNLAGRFQVPVIPAVAIMMAPVVGQIFTDQASSHHAGPTSGPQQPRAVIVAAITMAAIGALFVQTRALAGLASVRSASIHQDIAEAMAKADLGDDVLITTEAGMVAWKTDLTVVDLWGLNNKQIAHNGLLRPGEIAALEPDLLFAHVSLDSLRSSADDIPNESWHRMNVNLFCFAQLRSYDVVASWQSGEWVVLARPGYPKLPRLAEHLGDVKIDERGPDEPILVPSVMDCPPAD